MGAAKGLAATGSPIVALVTGALTATFGGVSARSSGRRALCPAEAGDLRQRRPHRRRSLRPGQPGRIALVAASALGVVTALRRAGRRASIRLDAATGKAGPGRDPKDVM